MEKDSKRGPLQFAEAKLFASPQFVSYLFDSPRVCAHGSYLIPSLRLIPCLRIFFFDEHGLSSPCRLSRFDSFVVLLLRLRVLGV